MPPHPRRLRPVPVTPGVSHLSMWFIQTSVEALLLPTDGAGRTTLTGTAAPWHHLVRDSGYSVESRTDIVEAPVRWSIWPWQQTGRRIHLPDQLGGHESLSFMVRAQPTRACVFAVFPKPGKRKSDGTIELIVVVPPEQFKRYETLVHFAMTLPSGYVALTVAAPAVSRDREDGAHTRALIQPGTSALMEGLEIVVARAKMQKFAKADIRTEHRSTSKHTVQLSAVHDEEEEWMHFAAAPIHEPSDDSESAS